MNKDCASVTPTKCKCLYWFERFGVNEFADSLMGESGKKVIKKPPDEGGSSAKQGRIPDY